MIVVMLVDSVAFPVLAQSELKVTVTGVVVGVTVATTLVVPYAESGAVPKVRDVKLTPATGAEALTLKPMDADTGVLPTVAFAVIVVAPPAVVVAALKLMAATPEEFVKAVPAAGVNVARVESATLNVTTTLATPAPVASKTVAFTVAGVLVVVNPDVGSVRVIETLGAPAIEPVVVLEGEVEAVVVPLPPQPANSAVMAVNIKAINDLAQFE